MELVQAKSLGFLGEFKIKHNTYLRKFLLGIRGMDGHKIFSCVFATSEQDRICASRMFFQVPRSIVDFASDYKLKPANEPRRSCGNVARTQFLFCA